MGRVYPDIAGSLLPFIRRGSLLLFGAGFGRRAALVLAPGVCVIVFSAGFGESCWRCYALPNCGKTPFFRVSWGDLGLGHLPFLIW